MSEGNVLNGLLTEVEKYQKALRNTTGLADFNPGDIYSEERYSNLVGVYKNSLMEEKAIFTITEYDPERNGRATRVTAIVGKTGEILNQRYFAE